MDSFPSRRIVRTLAAVSLLAAGVGRIAGVQAQQPAAQPVVYVMPVEGMIDLGIAPFLARTIREAEAAGAAAVLLDINTLGGRVDAAIAMRDTLLGATVQTVAFVHPRAISAGALIALATDTIVMARGGTIGAAMPVVAGGGTQPQAADEKSISYLRKEFRATAETRNRPPLFAEAMVDPDVEIPDVVAKGKLLTLSTTEALQHEVAEHTADTVAAALEAAGFAGAEQRRAEQTWAESLVRFLTNPIISSLLMTLGLLGLLVEIRTPGFAIPGTVGIASLALFFWGHWLVQLAGWEELLLVGIGLLLIGVEVFVLPGFGVTGIAGAAALVAGLGMTLVGAGATATVVVGALGRVATSLLVALGGSVLLLRILPSLPFGRRLILQRDMRAVEGYASAPEADQQWLGRTGTALSPLRPAGIADIDGARVDVVSDGSFVPAGMPIQVTRVDGNRIVVRAIAPRSTE